MGLLDDVIHEFHQELVETMKGLQQRAQDPPLQLGGKERVLGSWLCQEETSEQRGLWMLSLEIPG